MRDKPRRGVGPAWLAVMGDIRDMAVCSLRVGDRDALRMLPGHAAAMIVDARHLVEALTVAVDRMARYIPGYSSDPTTNQDHHRSRQPPSRTDTPTIKCIQLNAYLLHGRRKRFAYQ
jgi:hypothetical protein